MASGVFKKGEGLRGVEAPPAPRGPVGANDSVIKGPCVPNWSSKYVFVQ